jgi:hypothetical protein
MMLLEKKLAHGFVAEFERSPSGSNNCYLIKWDQGGSLAAVEANGVLDAYADDPIEVPDSVLFEAFKWAESNGY